MYVIVNNNPNEVVYKSDLLCGRKSRGVCGSIRCGDVIPYTV